MTETSNGSTDITTMAETVQLMLQAGLPPSDRKADSSSNTTQSLEGQA